MTLIFQAIVAALQFPSALSAFLKILKNTPEENHNELMARIQVEAAAFRASGRPS